MKVTVCELADDPQQFRNDWQALVAHAKSEASDLVLLPELTFSPWVCWTDEVNPAKWEEAVAAYDASMELLADLAPAVVLGTRPVSNDGKRHNEAYVCEPGKPYQEVHHKYYLPEEPGFWEASWYQRGEKEFSPAEAGPAKVGFLICTEMWFTEHARAYAKQGIHLLAVPRATEFSTAEKWVAGGRAAAVMSGAYCISSNRNGKANGVHWGSASWVIDPDGEVLARTSEKEPFATVEIDLEITKRAKQTYPRYVLE